MMESLRAAAVIPAYNEAATIRDVAERTLNYVSTVIIVDDGSSDGTADEVRELPVVSLKNEHNAGKAAALWQGMEYAKERGFEAVITLDGDGQHRPEDIPALIECASEQPDTLVIAARTLKTEEAPRARLFANRFADFWISWAGGHWIRDTQSGFRLYPARLIREIKVPRDKAHGFVFESEILIEALRMGYRCVTVPIAAIYHRGARPSHFRPVMDITRIVIMVAGKLLKWGLYPKGLLRALATRNDVTG